MARSKSSKSAKPSKLQLAKYSFRGLVLAGKARAKMRELRRRKEEPAPSRSSRKFVALGLAGAILAGLYLFRNRIPGPWRSESAVEEFAAPAPPPPPPAVGEEPKADDGPAAPEIAVA